MTMAIFTFPWFLTIRGGTLITSTLPWIIECSFQRRLINLFFGSMNSSVTRICPLVLACSQGPLWLNAIFLFDHCSISQNCWIIWGLEAISINQGRCRAIADALVSFPPRLSWRHNIRVLLAGRFCPCQTASLINVQFEEPGHLPALFRRTSCQVSLAALRPRCPARQAQCLGGRGRDTGLVSCLQTWPISRFPWPCAPRIQRTPLQPGVWVEC